MSLWKYLKERKLYFILVIFILLIVDITLFLDPNLSESIDTLIYINMLSILTTIIFIIMGYSRYKRELNQFIHNIKENSNMEDNYIDKEIKSIIEEKKEEVDSLRNELEEINDYMTNWIHEVKIPISVLQMIGKRINEVDSSREISKQINSQVSRIDKLVEQAMYSSRAGNYNSDFLINEVDLGQVVKEVIKKNKYQFIYNKIDLQVSEINKTILTDKKWITHI